VAPRRGDDVGGRRQQGTSWAAANYLLRTGHSWSGRERNNCYVNMGNGSFADVSYLSGVGFIDDARGVAPVDWDGDGDLDLWLNNRSSPKVRFMRNDHDGDDHFVAFKLTGTTCNRDAVGARVEIRLADGTTMIRTVRAGVNYSVQGTKWLHFGLGEATDVASIAVRWPDGSRSDHGSVRADRRYVIEQGTAEPRPFRNVQRTAGFEPRLFTAGKETSAASVPLGAPIQLPGDITLEAFDGTAYRLSEFAGQPVLVNMWASWCAGCMVELRDFVANREAIEQAGVAILAHSVDKPEDRDKAVATADRMGFWFPAGMADERLLNLLVSMKKVIFDQYEDLPLPTSLLIDGQGRLARIYLGPCDSEALRADVERLRSARSDVDVLYQASAYPTGVWERPEVWLAAQVGNQFVRMTQFLAGDGHIELAAFYAGALARYTVERDPPERAKIRSISAILKAARAAAEHDQEAAAALFRQALTIRPDHVDALVGLTSALLDLGEIDAAGEAFDAALPSMRPPETAHEWTVRGVLQYRLGRTAEALPGLERAVEADPSNALEMERFDEAVTQLQAAADGSEPSALIEQRLGQALDRAGRADEALAHFERSLELAPPPTTLETRSLRGQSAFRVGRWEEAIDMLAPVVADDPGRHLDRGMLGLSLAYAGRDAEAVPHLAAAMTHLPPDAANEYIYGIALARTGDLEGAVPRFEKALEIDPARTDALRMLAIALDRLGRGDEAIIRFEAYREAVPNDADAHVRLAGLYERSRRLGDAVATYRTILRVDPDNEAAPFRLAWLLATAPDDGVRDGAEALRMAQRVVAKAGREYPAVLDALAAAYAENGQFDEAVATASEAVRKATAQQNAGMARAIQARLDLYRAGRAYRTSR
jgi:tetratricopeptide (TPR) repeat protein